MDSKIKMIDIWLLHGLIMPFLVFLALVMSKLRSDSPNDEINGTDQDFVPSSHRNGGIDGKMKVNGTNGGKDQKDGIEMLGKENWTILKIGGIVLPGLSTVFFVVFFAVALSQHM